MKHLACATRWLVPLFYAFLSFSAQDTGFAQVVVQVTIPGHADPWLAGMPDGAGASCCYNGCCCDESPFQSPVQVPDLCLITGTMLSFLVTGTTAQDPAYPLLPPDGGSVWVHEDHDDNGIAGLAAPISSCLGVFLADQQPDQTPPPDALDFTSPASVNYLTLAPTLKQVFFIGDGLTETGVVQQVVVPTGATRLYLGTMDSCQWSNNIGQFDVIVTDPCGSVAVQPVGWSALKSWYR